MQDEYFGDSYDIVKRFWAESLESFGTLYAHLEYVPDSIRDTYPLVTGIPLFIGEHISKRPFGIFLDPDVGVPTPTSKRKGLPCEYATLTRIDEIMRMHDPAYMVCFDQSHQRGARARECERRRSKMQHLQGLGIHSFYYVSHAPFLFMSKDNEILARLKERITGLGIPLRRLDFPDVDCLSKYPAKNETEIKPAAVEKL